MTLIVNGIGNSPASIMIKKFITYNKFANEVKAEHYYFDDGQIARYLQK